MVTAFCYMAPLCFFVYMLDILDICAQNTCHVTKGSDNVLSTYCGEVLDSLARILSEM